MVHCAFEMSPLLCAPASEAHHRFSLLLCFCVKTGGRVIALDKAKRGSEISVFFVIMTLEPPSYFFLAAADRLPLAMPQQRRNFS